MCTRREQPPLLAAHSTLPESANVLCLLRLTLSPHFHRDQSQSQAVSPSWPEWTMNNSRRGPPSIWASCLLLTQMLCSVTWLTPDLKADAGKPPLLRYEAEVVETNGLVVVHHYLVYDDGRFRLDSQNPTLPDDRHPQYSHSTEIFDDIQPFIVWNYTAYLHTAHMSSDFGSGGYQEPGHELPFPSFGGSEVLQTLRPTELRHIGTLNKARSGRIDSICGYPCRIYEYRVVPSRPSYSVVNTDGGYGVSANGTIISRFWVETHTDLVLRSDTLIQFPKGVPVPPLRHSVRVIRLHFSDSPVPRSIFQLPPHTTAYIPKQFASIKLPYGVTGVPESEDSLDPRHLRSHRRSER